MLEFVLEFSYMKIDMTISPSHFSQIACHQDADLHNFLGPSLNNEKFQVFVAVASILSTRFPYFFYPKLATGLATFYRFYLAQLQKKYSEDEIARALVECFEPGEITICSKITIPSHFAQPSVVENIFFLVPIRYALHLIATRRSIPKKGKVLIPFSQIHELLYGMWDDAIKELWERRDFDITFDVPDPKSLGFPQEGLFFRHPLVEYSFEANFTTLILLPAIKKLYIENRRFANSGTFQLTPLSDTGDFMQDYWPLLPPCFANPIKKCFDEKDHLKFEQRFIIFRYLFGLGISYEVVEEMWKRMVLNSKYGGEMRFKKDLQAVLKEIHKKHTEYQKDKDFFIGGCQHIMTKTNISCPYHTVPDIEDITASVNKCQQACGQTRHSTFWNPVVACKTITLNKKN